MENSRRGAATAEIKFLLERSVLSHFSTDFVQSEILPRLNILELEAGKPVPRDPGTVSVYIVLRGRVALLAGGDEVGIVDEGRALELPRVLESANAWAYSWKSLESCTIASFSRELWLKGLASDPELERYLERMVTSRAIQRFKHDLNLLGFTAEESRATITRLSDLSHEQLIAAAPKDRIVVVNSGLLEIGGVSAGSAGVFRTGDILVLSGDGKQRFNVLTPGRCWTIEKKKWKGLAAPSLVDGIFDTLALNRETALQPLPSDDAQFLDSEDSSEIEEDLELDTDVFAVDPQTAGRRQNLKRLPFVAQHDIMDCGAACLSMVLKFYGKSISIPRLRGLLGTSVDGTSLADLVRGAGHLGLESVGIETEVEGLSSFCLPAIVLMEYHFVVIFHVDENEVVICDPGSGRLRLPRADFERQYSGQCLLLKPNDEFKRLKNDRQSFWKYTALLSGHEWELARAGLTVGFVFCLNLVYPVFMQMLFDEVLLKNKVNLLSVFLLGFTALSVAFAFGEVVRDYLLLSFAAKFDAKINSQFLSHALALPLSYFSVRRTGDFLSRLNELEKIRDFLSGKSVVLLLNLFSVIIYGAALYCYHPIFLVIVVSGIPVYALLVTKLSGYLQQLLDMKFIIRARSDSQYLEAITNLETVQTQNYAISSRWRWESAIVDGIDAERKYQHATNFADGFLDFLQYGFSCVILLAAMYLHTQKQMTIGQIVAVGAIGTQLLGPVLAILKEWHSIAEVLVSVTKVDDVFSSRREDANPVQTQCRLQGEVELRNVGFRYGGENSPTVLEGIELKIAPGESVALVGPSGSGKSTLVNMINLLYQPTEGDISFDRVKGSEMDLEFARRQIGMILQENNIFTGTVLENIAFGDKAPSMKRAIEAAKLADAHEFISKLGKGYLQPLSPTPELSGGERQRLCIARAFYLKPRILILDEATSALDSVSEQRIIRNLEANRNKTTTITIAHRLSSVVKMDRIIVMEGGKIVEEGSHRVLMQKRGTYYDLFRRQLSA